MEKPCLIPLKSLQKSLGIKDIDILEIYQLAGFKVKRFYMLYAENVNTIRGNHAHLNQRQILLNLHGESKVILTDKEGIALSFELGKEALFIPPSYWIELYMNEGSKIACFAEQSYQDLDTIADKNVFLRKNR